MQMKINQIQPGYRVIPDIYKMVKDEAEELSEKNGFHVSDNKALAVLIRKGRDASLAESAKD